MAEDETGGLGSTDLREPADPVEAAPEPSVAVRPVRFWRRRRLVALLTPVLLIAVLVAVPTTGAATTPGNEDFKAKLADWLRGHHASAVVSPVESWYYTRHAPPKGGRLRALNALPPRPVPPTTVPAPTAPPGLPVPATIPLVTQPALAGEGVWQAVGPPVDSTAAMYEVQFRADQTYTSQITSAVWIDPTRLHLSLVPGLTEPGGSWAQPPDLTGAQEKSAVAAFNGGFRFQDAHGGFFLDGHTAVPLRTGAASVVIDGSGKVDVGAWGSEVTMASTTVAVLQNLVPIVDNGQPASSAAYDDASIWGSTIRNSVVVPRSGLGVTATGALVYVAGPALSARTLAESLQRAGAVRAMALDLNPEWVTFNYFAHAPDGSTSGTKLYPQMDRPASRYLGPTEESRDFFAVTLP